MKQHLTYQSAGDTKCQGLEGLNPTKSPKGIQGINPAA